MRCPLPKSAKKKGEPVRGCTRSGSRWRRVLSSASARRSERRESGRAFLIVKSGALQVEAAHNCRVRVVLLPGPQRTVSLPSVETQSVDARASVLTRC